MNIQSLNRKISTHENTIGLRGRLVKPIGVIAAGAALATGLYIAAQPTEQNRQFSGQITCPENAKPVVVLSDTGEVVDNETSTIRFACKTPDGSTHPILALMEAGTIINGAIGDKDATIRHDVTTHVVTVDYSFTNSFLERETGLAFSGMTKSRLSRVYSSNADQEKAITVFDYTGNTQINDIRFS